MTRSRAILGVFIGGVVVIGIGWMLLNRMYLEPRAELLEELESQTATLAIYKDGMASDLEQREQLRSYVDRTLGGAREVVDHRLRTRLNRLVEASGLTDATVTTGQIAERTSPARSKYRRLRSLRERVDFVEVEATVSGTGSLAQALEVLDRLDAERWLHRIERVRLDPRENGAACTIVIRLRTLFIPDMTPDVPPAMRDDYEPHGDERLVRLVNINPFRVPPPPTPAPPRQVATPEPTAADPPPAPRVRYDQWVLTGVVTSGASGLEAWLRHQASNERRRLAIGDQLHAMRFEGRIGLNASFSLDGELFEVVIGDRLSERQMIAR